MEELLKRRTDIPLYQQLAEELKEQIAKGVIKENERILTEMELSEKYKISRITVRKALELLVDEEILTRKRGIGTFVSGKKMLRNMNQFMGFTQNCEQNGQKPGTKFLSAEILKAKPSDLKNLQLGDDDRVISIRRLRYCDDMPVIIEENHFPRKYAFLLAEDLNGSLHEILTAHGVNLREGIKKLGVCHATREEAALLGVAENEALLFTKDTTFDEKNEPVYYGKNIINPERYEFSIVASGFAMGERHEA